ncbi:MAG: DUF2264 domain-containing protein [Microbacterium sp.]|uniref:DUF2264 domain-containing protein n=1 Tax=Microbacterium sp. TaxID=51671 RepID=UPI003F81A62B
MTQPAALSPLESTSFALRTTSLPAEDRTVSPYTGLTRAHWVAVAEDLLFSAAEYRSESGARINLPGRPSIAGDRADGLEGFSRTFLLAAFLHVGDPVAGEAHLARYVEGLIRGTDRGASRPSDAWEPIGHIHERWGQSQVEAASIALSLHLTKADSWNRLPLGAQDDVEAWLRTALDKEPAPNNWYLFSLTVASFLEAVGRGDEATSAVISRGLALADQWYRGEGWYSDGDAEAYDHYIGWAMHPYLLFHAVLSESSELKARFGPRLTEFLRNFSLTFDRNGAPLHMGRSLTYRMAAVASIALGEVTGFTPLEHGQSRRIMSADLRYFLERGATRNGILTMGWHGPHQATLQVYSGPGSPYWASKGFLALMLSADHPFWTEVEAELITDTESTIRPIRPTGLLVQTTACDGLVRVHNHGSDDIPAHQADAGAPDPLYARFAYSTRTGPTPLRSPSDNDFQIEYRENWSARRRIHRAGSGSNWVASWHAPRFPGNSTGDGPQSGPVLPAARVQSLVVVHDDLEVRVHRIRHVPPASSVRLSGWAVASEDLGGLERRSRNGDATVSTDALISRLHGVIGWERSDTSLVPSGTAFGTWAAVPELHGTASADLFVAIASLSTRDSDPAHRVSVHVKDDVIHVTWHDDERTTVVDLRELDWC